MEAMGGGHLSQCFFINIARVTEDRGCDQGLADVVPGDGDQHTELSHNFSRAEEYLQSADWTLGVEKIMIRHRAGRTRIRPEKFKIFSTYRVTLSQARIVTGRRNRLKFSNSS